jgi:hypothetical protein
MQNLAKQVKNQYLVQRGLIGAANAVPLMQLADASKFERCALLALSVSFQRGELSKARQALKNGNAYLAACYINSFKAEKRASGFLLTFGNK